MADLATTFRKWLKQPLFVILLVMVVYAFWTAHGSYSFTGAVVGPDIKIVSVNPDLTNKVLTPGQTVSVTVTTKNDGPTDATYRVEHRLVADKNFPEFLAVIDPVGNAVSGEDDSVITRLVSDHKPGELVDIVFSAPVPTDTSTIAGSVNNWDDTYVQIVGLYQNSAAGYMNNEYKVNTNVHINSQYTGQEFEDVCEVNSDCSGWGLGFSACEDGMCVEKEFNLTSLLGGDDEADEEPFSFKEFYADQPLVVWGIVIVLAMLILGFAVPGRRR